MNLFKLQIIIAVAYGIISAGNICSAQTPPPLAMVSTGRPLIPTDPYMMKAWGDKAHGNYAAEIADWQDELKYYDPTDTVAIQEEGRAYEKLGQADNAIALYKTFLTQQPGGFDYEVALFRLTILECQANDWTDALTAYNLATEMDRQIAPDAQGHKSLVYRNFDPQKPDIKGLEVTAYLYDGDYECAPNDYMIGTAEGFDSFKKALALDPTNAIAQYYYAYGEYEHGDKNSGLADMTKLVNSSDPDMSNRALKQIDEWRNTHVLLPNFTQVSGSTPSK